MKAFKRFFTRGDNMKSLYKYNMTDKDIIDLLIQCYLVKHNGRPAYLFQTVDVKDYRGSIIPTLVSYIKSVFPDLHTLRDAQGLFITKNMITPERVATNTGAGRVLGYLCAGGYDKLDRNKPTYTYDISVDANKYKFSLFSFICQTKKYEKQFDNDYKKIKQLLVGNKNLPFFKNQKIVVRSVVASITEEMPPSYYLELLLHDNKENQTNKTLQTLSNYLFNIGFQDKQIKLLMKSFDPHNQTHRGVMAALVCYFQNPLLEPFYPLQTTGRQEQVQKQIDRFGQDLVHSFRLSSKT